VRSTEHQKEIHLSVSSKPYASDAASGHLLGGKVSFLVAAYL
jgi:hypothetical protein